MISIDIQDRFFLFFLLFFLILLFTSLIFSPLFLYFLSFIGLLLLSPIMNSSIIRYCILIFTFFSLLLIVGSRNYYDELASDLSIYSSVLDVFYYNPVEAITFFGGGYEVGWTLVYGYFFSHFNFTPIQQSLINIILSSMVIIFWIETKIKPLVNKRELGILYFMFFLFVNVGVMGFLQRQSLTLGLLLFALTAKNNKKFIFFVIFASIFHISAILTGFFIYVARNINLSKALILKIILCCILFRLFFENVIYHLLSFFSSFNTISHKLDYFVDLDFRISTLRYVILFFCLFLILISHIKVPEDLKIIYNFAVLSSIFVVSFVGVPLFADRLFMVSMVIYGVYYFLFFYRNYKYLATILAILYFVVVTLERFNLLGTLAVGDFYWARYEYIGDYIFYYLNKI